MSVAVQRVLVADNISAECGDRLRLAGLHATETGKLTSDQLIDLLQSHEALFVRSATKVTAEVIEASPRLKLIGRAGTGVDNIDVQAATRHGVLVINTPGGNTLSAAEHTCALIAALSRQLPAACASLKAGHWQRSQFLGSELHGKTLAVLGLGRIGREVAHRMLAFGMKVIGYDPMVSAEAAMEFHVEKRELDSIWPEADYITVHTPLIPQTRNLIGDETLCRCKRGVRVVNVARGGIVDEVALLSALEEGQCGGAALDVFAEEPPADLRLLQHPRVICTPHLGASTSEAQLRVATELAGQLVTAVKGGALVGLVNGAAIGAALRPSSQPWVTLGRTLGAVLAPMLQTQHAVNCKLELNFTGQQMEQPQSYLGSAVLLGLLAGRTQADINLVSAPLMAAEVGLSVTQCWSDRLSVGCTVTARLLTAADGRLLRSVTGTLQSDQPTLLELNEARFQPGVTATGRLLIFEDDGKEQTMGQLITSLSASGHQVASVLTSSGPDTGARLLVVRLQPSTEPPPLQGQHPKLLLQATF